MHWTDLIWVALYCAAGWFLADLCEPGDDLRKLTVFLIWPVLLGLYLAAVALLVLFTLAAVGEELIYDLLHKQN